MFGDIQVSLSGGVRAPFFFSGQHTNADWNGGIKDHPAPWAEIGTHRLVVTVPSSYVREISDPQKIVDIYEAAMDAYADLAVYPPDRPNNERLVLDCDISFGWLHSGYPVMGYLEQAPDHLSTGIGDISEVERKWGMFHEFGHNHQIGSATPPHTGEVTCNLFSVYLAETVMKANRTGRQSLGETRASEVATYLASGTYQDDFEGVGLVLYMMLQENVAGPGNITGGWDYLKRLLLKYQDIEVTDPVTDADSAQRWIIESSREAGINLVDFYQQWKWPVAPETKAAVDALGLRALPAYMDAKKPCGAAPINFCQDCCLTGYA